ncbi:GlmU family protein [Salinibacter altiplanensis]|uniref:GlmU family protein n=1 Tax=Salinibacter altiplanensis TaxID=1803181 RepID=UPI000C9F68A7|nr:GlmU family protein [Salinibacter altiplanensis]
MHLCLFEDPHVAGLRPLVDTRAVYDLRLGGRTLLETACDAFGPSGLVLHARPIVADVTRHAHSSAAVNVLPDGGDVLFVNGRYVAGAGEAFRHLTEAPARTEARAFVQNGSLVAAWVPEASARLPEDVLARPALTANVVRDLPVTDLDDATLLRRPWDLLDTLRPALARDAEALAGPPVQASLADRPHATTHESATSLREEQIHLGTGATIKPGAILNAEDGPIVLGANVTVHERAVLRGPCYFGPKTQVKIGANMEGVATGTWCKIGGEVHDAVLQGFSNKGHPGFLGHSVLGRWCNLGADTNTSNLKNDYGTVSAYAPDEGRFVDTGRQFAGLFMGDHSKCGINTMFNTGTIVGANCNLFGGDFPPRYVPPFSWGGASGFTAYRLDKACAVAERVMGRRDTPFTDADRALLTALFERTQDERAEHHS